MTNLRMPPLEQLVRVLSRLPAIGRRSAERIAFRLVTRQDGLVADLIASLTEVQRGMAVCKECGMITAAALNPCRICSDETRVMELCLVEDARDVFALEDAGVFRGYYQVLPGRISPMNGVSAGDLRLDAIRERIRRRGMKEVLLAFNTNVESDATAHYLAEIFRKDGLKVTRLAFGIPAGSGIEYTDAVTLSRALKNRESME